MKHIDILSLPSINDLAGLVQRRHPNFLLLLAWNAPEMNQAKLIDLFRPIVDRGLVYFCAWGDNCEAIHDAVEQCDIQKYQEDGRALTPDSILMTTWHARESLREALWFFKVCTLPAESFAPYACDRFAVAVGNPDWAAELERAVRSIDDDADD